MKSGFILLEIIIAIALGSLIGLAVFSTFFQVNRAYNTADRVIAFDVRATTVQHQLERDISGAFVPFVVEGQKTVTTVTQVTVKDKTGTKIAQKKEQEKEVQEKPLDKAFYVELQDNLLALFSFITSNPMHVYGKQKPRIARVTYSLVPEKQRGGGEKTYTLFRQESSDLLFKKLKEKGERGSELVMRVGRMSLEFTAKPAKQKEDNQKKKDEKEKEQEAKYETFSTWGPQEIKKLKRELPNIVTTTITFWDVPRKRKKKFVFKTAIVTDTVQTDTHKKKKQQTKAAPKKNKIRGGNEGKRVAYRSSRTRRRWS